MLIVSLRKKVQTTTQRLRVFRLMRVRFADLLADTNQSESTVPEPTSIDLLSLIMRGGAFHDTNWNHELDGGHSRSRTNAPPSQRFHHAKEARTRNITT